jgi:hypothetical protein
MISDTGPFGFVAVGQIPNTVVPNNTSFETDGASVFRSTTPSHNSSLNHELSPETIENRHTAIGGLHARAGEDTNVHEKPSSNLAQTPQTPPLPLPTFQFALPNTSSISRRISKMKGKFDLLYPSLPLG